MSYSDKSFSQIFQQHEKKDKYNQRVINIEKSLVQSSVFTTSREMAPQCTKVNKRLVEKIAV